MQGPAGEFGGEVLRVIEVSGGKLFPGTVISSEAALKMPPGNRRALAKTGKVRWFEDPKINAAQAQAAETSRYFKVNNGPGKFRVFFGSEVTTEPVDKETADKLVADGNKDN